MRKKNPQQKLLNLSLQQKKLAKSNLKLYKYYESTYDNKIIWAYEYFSSDGSGAI